MSVSRALSVTVLADVSVRPLSAIVADLKSAGLRPTRQMPRLGIVSGEVSRGHVRDLKRVAGVKSVESQKILRPAARTEGRPATAAKAVARN